MGIVKKIFGGGGDSSAKQALALQQQQQAQLEKQLREEKEKKDARLRAVRAAQGSGRRGLLFAETGESGVKKELGA